MKIHIVLTEFLDIGDHRASSFHVGCTKAINRQHDDRGPDEPR